MTFPVYLVRTWRRTLHQTNAGDFFLHFISRCPDTPRCIMCVSWNIVKLVSRSWCLPTQLLYLGWSELREVVNGQNISGLLENRGLIVKNDNYSDLFFFYMRRAEFLSNKSDCCCSCDCGSLPPGSGWLIVVSWRVAGRQGSKLGGVCLDTQAPRHALPAALLGHTPYPLLHSSSDAGEHKQSCRRYHYSRIQEKHSKKGAKINSQSHTL